MDESLPEETVQMRMLGGMNIDFLMWQQANIPLCDLGMMPEEDFLAQPKNILEYAAKEMRDLWMKMRMWLDRRFAGKEK